MHLQILTFFHEYSNWATPDCWAYEYILSKELCESGNNIAFSFCVKVKLP